MNIAAMAAISLLIFADKTLPWGRSSARIAAGALIAYGGLVLGAPQLLSTFRSDLDGDAQLCQTDADAMSRQSVIGQRF